MDVNTNLPLYNASGEQSFSRGIRGRIAVSIVSQNINSTWKNNIALSNNNLNSMKGY